MSAPFTVLRDPAETARILRMEAEPEAPRPLLSRNVKAMNIAEFLASDFPPRENMLAPWLGVSSLALMYAWRGTGKTLVAHSVAWAVATGGGFLNWTAPQPKRVLLIDGEMRAVDIQQRFSSIRSVSELEPDPEFL